MAVVEVLPTENPEWGVWGTATQAGLDADLVWSAGFRALLEGVEGLTPETARLALDSRWGRHWVDALPAGALDAARPTTAAAVRAMCGVPPARALDAARVRRHMLDTVSDPGWFKALAEILLMVGRRTPLRARWIEDITDPVTLRLLDLAKAGLGVQTFRARGSDRLDFQEVSVVALGRVLRAAYDAGLAAGRGDPHEPTTGAPQG